MPAPDSPKGLGFISSALSAPVSPAEAALRPLSFADFTGQLKTVERLQVMVGAARKRGEALNHILLSGPPGLGKTTRLRVSRAIRQKVGIGGDGAGPNFILRWVRERKRRVRRSGGGRVRRGLGQQVVTSKCEANRDGDKESHCLQPPKAMVIPTSTLPSATMARPVSHGRYSATRPNA